MHATPDTAELQPYELHGVPRYIILWTGALLSGLCFAAVVWALGSPRGGTGPLLLLAESPLAAWVMTLIAIGAATLIGAVVGRLVGSGAVGVFVLGVGVMILAMRTDTVYEAILLDASLMTMSVECVVLALLAIVAVTMICAFSGPQPDIEPYVDGETPSPWLSKDAGMSAMCGIASLVIIWLLAQSTMKGQVIMSAMFGGVVVGLIARSLAPHVQPRWVYVSPILFGVIGYGIARVLLSDPMLDAYIDGRLPPWVRVMPIDLASGTLVGVPIGLGWARSFMQSSEE